MEMFPVAYRLLCRNDVQCLCSHVAWYQSSSFQYLWKEKTFLTHQIKVSRNQEKCKNTEHIVEKIGRGKRQLKLNKTIKGRRSCSLLGSAGTYIPINYMRAWFVTQRSKIGARNTSTCTCIQLYWLRNRYELLVTQRFC